MSSLASIKTQIQALITLANATTGNNDTDLTTCVNSLIEGYGVSNELSWNISKRTAITNLYSATTQTKTLSDKIYYWGMVATGVIDYRKITSCTVNSSGDVTFLSTNAQYGIGVPFKLEGGASYTFSAKASVTGRLRVHTYKADGTYGSQLGYSSSGTNLTYTFTAPTDTTMWVMLHLDCYTASKEVTYSNISIVKN
jgi:hypothetical protein